MKICLPVISISCLLLSHTGISQNVGIGTTNPKARLHVADSSVVFTNYLSSLPATFSPPPIEGKGIRMMWYPQKGAFRTGGVDDGTLLGFDPNTFPVNQWDKDNIGLFSFASGLNPKAMGLASIAMGNDATAAGDVSVALGHFSAAMGDFSTAIGGVDSANGFGSTALGVQVTARGDYSLATGRYTIASGNNSTSMGTQINTNGKTGSFALGDFNMTSTLGNDGDNQMLMRFQGGYKLNLNDVTTALAINSKGNIGIGTTSPGQKLQVAGSICYTGEIGACSDIRYKENITHLSNPLSSVVSMNGFYYNWKKDKFPGMNFSDDRQIGFSAQEVEKLFPEIVMTDANGYKSVDYGRLTPVLVEAIKQQQQEIKELQEQVKSLVKRRKGK